MSRDVEIAFGRGTGGSDKQNKPEHVVRLVRKNDVGGVRVAQRQLEPGRHSLISVCYHNLLASSKRLLHFHGRKRHSMRSPLIVLAHFFLMRNAIGNYVRMFQK